MGAQVFSALRTRRGTAASVVLLPLVLAPLTIGIGIPGSEILARPPRPGILDYSGGPPGGFSALRAPFVALSLGLPLPGEAPIRPGTRLARTRPRDVGEIVPGTQVPPLSNDQFTHAASIGRVPYAAETDTAGATRESSEPRGCAALEGGGTVWFRYAAETNRGLLAHTFGSAYPAVLAVYRGSRLDGLQQVGCDSDAAGNAVVPFAARRGSTYYFQIAAALLQGGRLLFRLEQQGVTERISIAENGRQTDEFSSYPSISDDGRFIAYFSRATTLMQRGPDACAGSIRSGPCSQVYVYDRAARRTEAASVSTEGRWANGPSGPPAISADGGAVAFQSWSTNLVPGDTNVCLPPRPQNNDDRPAACEDVFVRDRAHHRTERVSVTSTGGQANGFSGFPSLSGDGRFVAFESDATNLVPGDTNACAFVRPVMLLPSMNQRYSAGGCTDVFVHDRATGVTERISVSAGGVQGNGPSWGPFISADGRFVAFSSAASNLVPGDTNVCPNPNPDTFSSTTANCTDVFVHDRLTRTITRVSVSSRGEQANGHSYTSPSNAGRCVSTDGRFILFFSQSHNLPEPGRGRPLRSEAYVHDMLSGTTTLVSASSAGDEANDIVSWNISMSEDGRYFIFATQASNVVPGDTNARFDVFLRDLVTLTTVRVSISSAGEQGNGDSDEPAISADGRVIAFHSHASNLVAGDTNLCADEPISCPDVFVHVRPHA